MFVKNIPPDLTKGWKDDDNGSTQPRGWRLQKVMINGKFQYDTFLIMERCGAVILPYHTTPQGETLVLLIRNRRAVVPQNELDTFQQMFEEGLRTNNFDEILPILGDDCWEAPRGLPEKSETILRTALRELYEESGVEENLITQVHHVGDYIANTTFFVQPVGFFLAETNNLVEASIHNQEATETILDAKWMPIQEAIKLTRCLMTATTLLHLQTMLLSQ